MRLDESLQSAFLTVANHLSATGFFGGFKVRHKPNCSPICGNTPRLETPSGIADAEEKYGAINCKGSVLLKQRRNLWDGGKQTGWIIGISVFIWSTISGECRTPSRPIGYSINFLISRNWIRGVAWRVVREPIFLHPTSGIRELEVKTQLPAVGRCESKFPSFGS